MPSERDQLRAAIHLHRTEKAARTRQAPADAINRAERRLREAVRRAGLPPTLARQVARMFGHYARKRLAGHATVWPGMAKMAAWGECGERMARKNFRQLEAGGVVHVASHATGGRRLSTEWWIDPAGLRRWLILTRANPSRDLLRDLAAILGERPSQADAGGGKPGTDAAENPELTGPEIDPETRNQNPELNPELSSARSREIGHRRAGRSDVAPAKGQRGGT